MLRRPPTARPATLCSFGRRQHTTAAFSSPRPPLACPGSPQLTQIRPSPPRYLLRPAVLEPAPHSSPGGPIRARPCTGHPLLLIRTGRPLLQLRNDPEPAPEHAPGPCPGRCPSPTSPRLNRTHRPAAPPEPRPSPTCPWSDLLRSDPPRSDRPKPAAAPSSQKADRII